MSLGGEYGTRKLGDTVTLAFTSASATESSALVAAQTVSGVFEKASFELRTDVDCYVKHGKSGMVAVTTTTGYWISPEMIPRIDVETTDERFLSVIGQASGTLYITKISKVASS